MTIHPDYLNPNPRPSRARAWAMRLVWVLIGMLITLFLIWAGIYAVIREDEFRDEIRKERCERMGENMPKELEKYCDDLGV